MNTDALYSFQLARGLLKALSLFQSEDRPALACAQFEIRANGMRHELTIVTTDGRRLASYQTEISQDTLWGELPAHEEILVDLEGCRKLPKVDGPTGDQITVEVYPKHVEFCAETMRYTARRLEQDDGSIKFPAWRAVIPAREPESTTQVAVNFDLLADFGKAAKWIGARETPLIALRSFGEDAPIAVMLPTHREFFGIIMPIKFENPETVPDWLRPAGDVTRQKPPAEDKAPTDEKIEAAIEIIRTTKVASTSTIQRRLRIGYNAAARIMEELEKRGIVGPENGSSPREILSSE